MDESTLNDLLECSVCLERLDTSSKVLPCQHTFCRKCLEVIVASRQELRCPECRVLVSVRIDDLPPNVLLMRILENLTKSSLTSANKEEKQEDNQTDEQNKAQQVHNFEQKLPPTSQKIEQLNNQQSTSARRRCLLPHAYALYDFDSTEPNDLHFKKGDLILLKHKIDINWYVGQLNGVEGTFPSNYVQVMVPLPSPQCVALYDFKMGASEEEGCLSFKKGAVIHVLRRVDDNWAEGRIGNVIGIFPIAFVELNALARHLLGNAEQIAISTMQTTTTDSSNNQTSSQSTQPQQTRNMPPMPLIDPTTSPLSSSQSNTTSPSASDSAASNNRINSNTTTTTTTSNSSCSSPSLNSNSMPNSPQQSLPTTPQHYAHGSGSVRYRNNREKRLSLNALLSTTNSNANQPALSIMQTNRHSAEILSIPSEELIVTDNLELATGGQPYDLHSQNAAEPQTTASREQQESVGGMQPASISSTRANVLKSVCGHSNIPPSLPWGYLALYPYKPRKNDELELKKGCVYIVTERCLDGWFKGKNWQDVSGVFPGNYVTPLRARDQQQLMHQWRFIPQPMPQAGTASSTQVSQNTDNRNITSTMPKHHTPPELPPRHSVQTTCASVWTKPLSHTVEAFFNRSTTSGKITANQKCTSSTNNDKSKEKEPKPKDSSTSAAVTLMKRLTNIKSRAKSPANTARHTREQQSSPNNDSEPSKLEQIAEISQNNATQFSKIQPVHVRSGSCPSQLLQSFSLELSNSQNDERSIRSQQQHKSQQHAIHQHGSERIKGHKERPRIPATRQSMDGTLRSNIYNIFPANQAASPYATPNSLILSPKCAQQHQIGNLQDIYATPHRKSQSLDANSIHIGPPTAAISMLPPSASAYSMQNSNIAAAITASATTKSAHCGRESRFRCIVPYPPNSDVELELHVGDIIYVQRKQKNGWYKGTHARTQKTGLFPASFVEPDL